jgi:hypothetical protein
MIRYIAILTCALALAAFAGCSGEDVNIQMGRENPEGGTIFGSGSKETPVALSPEASYRVSYACWYAKQRDFAGSASGNILAKRGNHASMKRHLLGMQSMLVETQAGELQKVIDTYDSLLEAMVGGRGGDFVKKRFEALETRVSRDFSPTVAQFRAAPQKPVKPVDPVTPAAVKTFNKDEYQAQFDTWLEIHKQYVKEIISQTAEADATYGRMQAALSDMQASLDGELAGALQGYANEYERIKDRMKIEPDLKKVRNQFNVVGETIEVKFAPGMVAPMMEKGSK